MRKQKGQLTIFILVGILVLAGVAGGAYFLGKSGQSKPGQTVSQSQPTPQPTSGPQASHIPDPTANWKTYTNAKVGFQVKYPPRYPKPALPSGAPTSSTIYADENSEGNIIFGEKSTDSFSIFVFPFTGTLDELLITQQAKYTRPYNGLPPDNFVTTTREVRIDGVKALWKISSYKEGAFAQEKHNNIFFTNKNYGFILNTWPDYNEKELNQILSTFRFIQ